jgi:hypothetical protein
MTKVRRMANNRGKSADAADIVDDAVVDVAKRATDWPMAMTRRSMRTSESERR